jgi:hypothetical protein
VQVCEIASGKGQKATTKRKTRVSRIPKDINILHNPHLCSRLPYYAAFMHMALDCKAKTNLIPLDSRNWSSTCIHPLTKYTKLSYSEQRAKERRAQPHRRDALPSGYTTVRNGQEDELHAKTPVKHPDRRKEQHRGPMQALHSVSQPPAGEARRL